MSEISRDTVMHTANLARIELSDDDCKKMTKELDEILTYAQMLDDIDLSDVKPLYHSLDLKNVMRDDEVGKSLDQEVALKNAKSTKDGQFKVPKML